MAIKHKGSLEKTGLVVLPDRKIVTKNDGTMQGTVNFKVDRNNEALLPLLESAHPDDGRLELFQRDVTRKTLKTTIMSGSYFGILSDPTPKIVQHPGSGGRDPIETHPDFADFGTEANGAVFDDDTQEFKGFFDKAKTEFYGVRSYLVPNITVNLSYWTYKTPVLRKLMTIKTHLKEVRKPPNVKNWLLTAMPYRQVGSLFQVTEQWMGSGPNGWSETIYG